MTDSHFANKVYEYMRLVPAGRVVSYSQVAAICGHPGAARVVGQIAHYGPTDIPWHRLVRASGGLASSYVPGGASGQMSLLKLENVSFDNDRVSMEKYQWWP